MKRLQFKCTLDSDVIVNASAATTGAQSSIDFLPGSLFLGIVAKEYEQFGDEQMNVFHNGSVRFGDAHPCPAESTDRRTLQIPASMYYPKLKSVTDACYIHHFYQRSEDHDGDQQRPQQLKQCRSGFYAFADGKAIPASVEKSFAIKSAYDREERRSKDEQMYGYESINAGLIFLFTVEVDNDALAPAIERALIGKQHIGRSKTAQYGLVKIEHAEFDEMASSSDTFTINGQRYATVYADSRLIFLDEKTGQPTFRPEANDLGLEGEIDWTRSQVRTFQYAPWNNKRQCRDTERCGIEKGSVFVVKLTGGEVPSTSQFVGSYQNEGFGRVIYNPDFLHAKEGTNGMAAYQICKSQPAEAQKSIDSVIDTPLLKYVMKQKRQREKETEIYEMVNAFVSANGKLFKGKTFASQWGAIRSIAMRCKSGKELWNELFDKKTSYLHHATPGDEKEEYRIKEMGYLVHGVASDKWDEVRKRKESLKDFIKQAKDNEFGDIACEAVINLAAEMAKLNKQS